MRRVNLLSVRAAITWLVIGLFSATSAFAGLSLNSLKLPDTFTIENEYYTITSIEPSQTAPGFLTFQIHSDHADYEVESLPAFKKLLHEIKVIERIKRGEGGKTGFTDGAIDSVKQTGSGMVKLAAHPVDSMKGLGKATKKLGRKIGGVFRKKEEGEKTSFGEKMLGGAEREIAKDLAVDVYTQNPYMKELLRRMAKARMGGKGAAFVGKLLLPVAGLAAVALTAGGLNGAADQLVNDQDKGELFRLNKQALLALGFKEGEVKALLNSPHYTPRETTYLRFYLEALKGVEGYQDIFNAARDAKTDPEARGILLEAQLAADSAKDNTYQRLAVKKEFLALKSADKLILVTPYDYLDKSALGDRLVDEALGLKKEWGAKNVELWNGGKTTAGFSTSVFLKGIKTKDWLLFASSA